MDAVYFKMRRVQADVGSRELIPQIEGKIILEKLVAQAAHDIYDKHGLTPGVSELCREHRLKFFLQSLVHVVYIIDAVLQQARAAYELIVI